MIKGQLTTNADWGVEPRKGDFVRITLAGAATRALDYQISGDKIA